MEYMQSFLRAAFLFFMSYAIVYTVHWLVGLVVATGQLSTFEEKQVQDLLPDAQAQQLPVSVVIPAHNEQECICSTVEALLRQDYPGLEILVINDGSSDGTEAYLLSRFPLEQAPLPRRQGPLPAKQVQRVFRCQIRGKRLVLVTKKNGGKGDALNCGFNLASGTHCVVVDADTRVRPGAIRIMASGFAADPATVVCAGAVGTRSNYAREVSLFGRLLVLFQRVEYFRTFYVHRILYDRLNANVIVSGAFAMFDRDLVIRAGGYRTDTIGEDMELTMRLHAFCLSQKRAYRIAYLPQAQCDTQVPFLYRDYFRQRRRWHVGLTQSLASHFYMIGKRYYGWVGTLAVLFTVVYEFLAPVIELAGGLVLILAAMAGIYNFQSAFKVAASYMVLSLLTQLVLMIALRTYRVEKISSGEMVKLVLAASTEWLLFHPINMYIKLTTFLSYRKYRRSWAKIRRIQERDPA